MTTRLMERKMGRKKELTGDEPRKSTTKISVDTLRKAKMVAIHKNIDLFDYIEAVLRPVVDRDYTRMIHEESEGR